MKIWSISIVLLFNIYNASAQFSPYSLCNCPEYIGGISQFHNLVEESLPIDLRNQTLELQLVFDTFEAEHYTLTIEQDSLFPLPESTIQSIENSLVNWDFTQVSKHYFQWREVIVNYSYPTDSLHCKKDQVACVLIEEICEGCDSDEDDYEIDSLEIFELFDVSKLAKFRSGYEEFNQFIDSFMIWPAGDLCFNGYVNLMFIVEPDGTLSHIETLGSRIGFGLEEEAIRLLKLTDGLWTPAKLRDKKVRMRFRMPVKFGIIYE